MSGNGSTLPMTEEQVIAALSKVNDPEIHRDLVTLGMVRDIEIDGGRVAFTVVLTTPACPAQGPHPRRLHGGRGLDTRRDRHRH